jgi:tetratricopeptide (TPR) repeat protein
MLGLGFQDSQSDVSELTAAGDEFFRMGNYAEAARNYALASGSATHSPEILFNLANSLYREKLYGEASTDFERAAELSRDPRFRARCKMGQANCAYRMAHGRDAFDTSQALAKVLDLYREAWSGNPALADAPHNIEVIKRKLQSLNEQLRSSSRDFMVQSPADIERNRHTAADDILREDQPGGKSPPRARRMSDRDW